ncbi:hypothetical protein EYF80_004838 [Liparis tanakae]|uniref:Uncharacterized protein n=1 Tax=Liparis tanakae TaxID=230148 RepID=A0A4Z2J5J4_9TELE|nr:hypothetical protein EYF80_004838 [Liparis tanakae]
MMHISDTEKTDQNNDAKACRASHLAETFVVKETQSLTKDSPFSLRSRISSRSWPRIEPK